MEAVGQELIDSRIGVYIWDVNVTWHVKTHA